MSILNKNQEEKHFRPSLEKVENEKQEYKLIETVSRRPGLRLYAYNRNEDKILEVAVESRKLLKLSFNGKDLDRGESYQKSVIDPRNDHFECLNLKSAKKRVERYKKGFIKTLSNLRPVSNGINLY